MTRHQKPREIIEHCLKPLGLNEQSPAAQEAVRRLVDAIKSLQLDAGLIGIPHADFFKMRAIVINETAHGYEA
ncbi:hypothetical protein [Bosea sp. NBC_00550]|uniref:hypothetical protein n=1 Tax=Bosea sp. NBC_00550 TaxID=2969621 RepID=UPI00222EE4D2|nr:hypothetical protein [Bosea sp. NBC_00550]UZF92832.1 hypothetical protein NWE53_01000 [Bosea sp. NBC_00550]